MKAIKTKTKRQIVSELKAKLEQFNAIKDSLVQTKDVASRFGVTRVTVTRWVRLGLLNPIEDETIGYVFDPEEIEAFEPPRMGNPNLTANTMQNGVVASN